MTLKLNRIMRVKTDESNPFSFIDFLLHVGEDKEQTLFFDVSADYTRFSDHVLFTPHATNLNDVH